MNYRFVVILIALLFILSFPPGAVCQESARETNLTSLYYNSYPLAVGGAFRSIASGAQAATVNPAGIPATKKSGVGFSYLNAGFLDAQGFYGAFFDGKTQALSTGFAFERVAMKIASKSISSTQLHLTLGREVGGGVSLASNLKYIHIGRDITSGGNMDYLSVDMGSIYKPVPQIAVSSVMKNIFAGKSHPEIPLLLSFGSAYILYEEWKLCFDLEIDLSTNNGSRVNYYFGSEILLARGFAFRGGFALDKVRDNPFVGVGLSLHGVSFTIEFTFAQRLDPLDQTYALSVELSM